MDPAQAVDPAAIFSAKGLVVAITGGGSGIGLAMAAAIAKTGAKKLYLLGRRTDVLESAAASLNAAPGVPAGTVVALPADITSKDSVQGAAKKIEEDAGHVDVLVNNAGKIGPRNTAAHEARDVQGLQEILLAGFGGDEDWVDTLRTNTASVALVSAAFLPLLDAGNRRRGWEGGRVEPGKTRGRRWTEELGAKEGVEEGDKRQSQIVTVASIAAFNRYVTAGVAYSASKAAAVHVGKSLATLLSPWGVRSNVIAPGVYPSAMTGEHDQEYPINQVPAGRKGGFDDIAGLILYLVGKGGSYLNGTVQVTDGGRLNGFPSTY